MGNVSLRIREASPAKRIGRRRSLASMPAGGPWIDLTYNGNSMTAASQVMRVLVVDDNKVTVDSLTTWLSGSGYEVRAAYDASALDVAKDFRPDVVLLDLNLPQIDGISVAHGLRAQGACEESLIIAITGYDDALYRLMAKEAGIDHYLVKPIDTEALEKLLRTKHG